MPSKKLNSQNTLSLWNRVLNCAEPKLKELSASLAQELKPGDRVILEGPLGAGKTTFARALLESLGVIQPPEGSPSFAIAHEYTFKWKNTVGEVIHLDFYRLKSEDEIEEAGIPSYFWERNAIVISEWLSNWPEFQTQVLKSGRVWEVKIEFSQNEPVLRDISISRSRPITKANSKTTGKSGRLNR